MLGVYPRRASRAPRGRFLTSDSRQKHGSGSVRPNNVPVSLGMASEGEQPPAQVIEGLYRLPASPVFEFAALGCVASIRVAGLDGSITLPPSWAAPTTAAQSCSLLHSRALRPVQILAGCPMTRGYGEVLPRGMSPRMPARRRLARWLCGSTCLMAPMLTGPPRACLLRCLRSSSC